MTSSPPTHLPTVAEAAAYSPQQVASIAQEVVAGLEQKVAGLQHQLDWFKRQVFGQKSERRLPEAPAEQLSLGEMFQTLPQSAPPVQSVAAHSRKASRKGQMDDADALPFFDAARVPVQVIEVANPETAGLSADQYEVIAYKDSYRLAQRHGSYVVLHYRRPLIKRLDNQALSCPPAPQGVIENSRADVSFIAGLMLDKFAYHLPLYRQHQRLQDAGITVSRTWLTQLVQQGAALLEPIYTAQLASIRSSRVIAMDETPIKAGRSAEPGKLKAAYFWPVYGGLDEVCFPFFESRRHEHVVQTLGLSPAEGAVLLSDGYGAYAAYAKKTGLTHAQCWAHARRDFFDAQKAEPEASAQALALIGELYEVEAQIRKDKLGGGKKQDYRLTHAKPVVERFFDWVTKQFERQGLLPSSPLTKALAYVRERRAGLEVYLTDPDVPIDTNHLERALRAIPMGRKAWLFCWTELGARHVGILQSLITTCRLHQIDPYTYLVDVLQRVAVHPAAEVTLLTPRLWKAHFADKPMQSPITAASS